MIRMANLAKKFLIGTSTASNATTTFTVDRLGYDYAVIDACLGTAADTTAATTVKVEEGDTTSSYSAIVAFTGGTATSSTVGFVIPATTGTTTPTAPYATFNIDCRPRKRYLRLSVTPGTTAIVSAVASLGRAKELPDSTTELNVGVAVTG